MNDPRLDNIFITQTIFGIIHVIYFLIYYGRYSTLNQKLNGIEKMEKAGVVEQSVINTSKTTVSKRIAGLRKWCYLPVTIISIIHFFWMHLSLPEDKTVYILRSDELITEELPHDFTMVYLNVIFISIGGALLIAAGNFVKGAHIIDPNKRFRGTTGRRW
jgi:hypothetical protein